ncbi:MAG: hypothetical protein V3T55_05155 [Anaerolineales bacterium]
MKNERTSPTTFVFVEGDQSDPELRDESRRMLNPSPTRRVTVN